MKKVLLVEDDSIIAFLTKKNLEKLNIEVVLTVTNGKDAIEAVSKLEVDFILMDINIEGNMDGVDTMMEIQKKSNLPVIYVTGNSDPQIVERASKTNVKGFLIKPINFVYLEQILRG